MIEREKNSKENTKWQFWFLVVFSLLLIETVVYYLPLRFEHKILKGEDHAAMDIMGEEMQGEEHKALYHEEGEVREGLSVNLNVTPVPVTTGAPTRLDFFVNEKPGNVPVTDLEIEHEKMMHVIGVRNDMEEFFHVHPRPFIEFMEGGSSFERDGPKVFGDKLGPTGKFDLFYTFLKPGLYKIWSEVKRDGVNHAFGHPELAVTGAGEPYHKQVSFARNVIVGDYQIALRLDESVPAGREADLLFDAHTLDSFEIELDDYLAAQMHIVIIKDDLKQFIHTHPESLISHNHNHQGFRNLISVAKANGGGHNTLKGGHGVNFHTTFPEPGLYKVFAQFRPAGVDLPQDEALTASFWIKAEEKGALGVAGWWTNLFISLMLIAILSWGVNRFLQVRIENRE